MLPSQFSLSTLYEKANPFDKVTAAVGQWIDKYPLLHKIVLFANHLFRGLCMGGMMTLLPFGFAVNGAICLFGSIFYRVTVERFCPFKFAIASFFGGIAIEMSKQFPAASLLWLTSIAYISHREVEKTLEKKCCCSGKG